jgi:hypothetical protein
MSDIYLLDWHEQLRNSKQAITKSFIDGDFYALEFYLKLHTELVLAFKKEVDALEDELQQKMIRNYFGDNLL